ncbi:MAG: BatA domain-containing protein, partial [Planctomycetota bacterium]
MSPLAISFVHPAILGGLALAGLPIIIHLLNRRRFKTMEWAAMDFLLKAAVRNRRRVRLENLLLLALRTLLVLCLILAVARPFTKREDTLASIFGSAGSTERVILLDDSHSMRAGQGNNSAFLNAKQLIKRLVTRLHDDRSGDRVTIVLGSRPREGGEGFARVAVASAQYKQLLRKLDALRVSDGVFDLLGAVETISDTYEEKEARVVLHLVSDFRSKDWVDVDGSVQPDVALALASFAERGEVRFLDVGAAPVQNVGVVDLKPADRAVIAGVPATFVATVKNHGPDPAGNVSLWFEFGDNVTLPIRIETTLQPGQTADVKTEFTFRAAGHAVVKARTQTD